MQLFCIWRPACQAFSPLYANKLPHSASQKLSEINLPAAQRPLADGQGYWPMTWWVVLLDTHV
jgi:hypothetical protein